MARPKKAKTAKAKKSGGKAKATRKSKPTATVNPNQEWVDFAKKNNIDKPFFITSEGAVRRTSDGKPYSSPEEMFADGGERDWSNVHKSE